MQAIIATAAPPASKGAAPLDLAFMTAPVTCGERTVAVVMNASHAAIVAEG